jgi:hypothetical protein
MDINDTSNYISSKINYCLNNLETIKINEHKIKNIDFLEKKITLYNQMDSHEYQINFDELQKECEKEYLNNKKEVSKDTIETTEENINKDNENNVISQPVPIAPPVPPTPAPAQTQQVQPAQTGGNNKNIFKSSKYSETSSAKFSELSNYSKTSSAMYNNRSDNFSDTSEIGQIGGGLETSDTLRSISELNYRKNKSSHKNSLSTTTFKSGLDIGIFKKLPSHMGGSKSNSDLKKKMLEAGINSSSTSSICE